MRRWLRGKPGGVIAFLAVALLVAGGLGWVTDAAPRVESEQQLAHWRLEKEREAARRQADYQAKLRVALWRLDSRVSPILATEASRPYSQYSALFPPATALHANGQFYPPGSLLEPSPLLNAELPNWILLHFQVDPASGWTSPEVPGPELTPRLKALKAAGLLGNLTEARRHLLQELAHRFQPVQLLANLKTSGLKWNLEQTALLPPSKDLQREELQRQAYDYKNRAQQQARVMNESQMIAQNSINQPAMQQPGPPAYAKSMGGPGMGGAPAGSSATSRSSPAGGKPVKVQLSFMTPVWFCKAGLQDMLLFTRLVRVGNQEVCQGLLLDHRKLAALLADEVHDVFPKARIVPVLEKAPLHPEATMSALPLELVPGVDLDTAESEVASAPDAP